MFVKKLEELGIIDPPAKYKVEVKADNSGTWAGNGLVFDTVEEAEVYAVDLYSRWTAVREMRVLDVATDKVMWQQPSR